MAGDRAPRRGDALARPRARAAPARSTPSTSPTSSAGSIPPSRRTCAAPPTRAGSRATTPGRPASRSACRSSSAATRRRSSSRARSSARTRSRGFSRRAGTRRRASAPRPTRCGARSAATRSRTSSRGTSSTRTSATSAAASARSRRGSSRRTCAARPTSSRSRRSCAAREEAWERGATEVCLQGGIHPAFTGDYYADVVRAIREAVPGIHVHAFSALEVWQGAATLGLSLADYLARLRDLGLGSLPGTAAEVLDDEVRRIICPDKVTTAQWLAVHDAAHRVGLRSNVTLMFGHVDTPRSWARHLLRAREQQRRSGGFTEFVPLPFVPMEAPIYLQGRARRGPTFRETLLVHAVARLALHPEITNIQASWVKLGPEGTRQALAAGRERPRRDADERVDLALRRGGVRAGAAARADGGAHPLGGTQCRASGRPLYGDPPEERVRASFGAGAARRAAQPAGEGRGARRAAAARPARAARDAQVADGSPGPRSPRPDRSQRFYETYLGSTPSRRAHRDGALMLQTAQFALALGPTDEPIWSVVPPFRRRARLARGGARVPRSPHADGIDVVGAWRSRLRQRQVPRPGRLRRRGLVELDV